MIDEVNIAETDIAKGKEVLRSRMSGLSQDQVVCLILGLLRRQNDLHKEVVKLRRDLGHVA